MFSISFAVLMLFQITTCKEPDESDKPDEPVMDWIQIPRFEGQFIISVTVLDSSIYVVCDSIYVSTDDAKTWKSISTGLPIPANGYAWVKSFGSLSVNDTTYLFAGTVGEGIYRSTDKGLSWQQVNDGLDRFYITAFGSCDGIIYTTASGYSGYPKFYYSTDRGQTWIESTNALANTFGASVSIGNKIFFSAGGGVGVMITSNKGQSWKSTWNPETGTSDVGLFVVWIEFIATNGKDIFVGGVPNTYYTTNQGRSWAAIGPDYIAPRGNHAVMKDSTIMVDYFVSHNYGRTWSEVNKGLPFISFINAIAILGNKIYLGLGNSGLWVNTSILEQKD